MYTLMCVYIYIYTLLGKVLPTDFHIFQRGGYTTNQKILGELMEPVAGRSDITDGFSGLRSWEIPDFAWDVMSCLGRASTK